MPEISYFWNGTTIGDATNAPYDHLEFTRVYSKLLASDASTGFVTPGYLNSLNVQESPPPAATVRVVTGAAFVKGFLYENTTAQTLTIAANASGNPRIDRIILRVNFAAQTVRLAVLQGIPAAVPGVPALTQTYGTTFEVALAQVWAANGFATITNADILDERTFMTTSLLESLAARETNYIRNSEFFGVNIAIAGPLSVAWGWNFVSGAGGTMQTVAVASRPVQMQRGRSVQIDIAGVTDVFSQTFIAKPSTTYTFRCLVQGGSKGAKIAITTNSGAPVGLTRNLRIDNSAGIVYQDVQIVYTTEADASSLTLSISPLVAGLGGTIRVGQCICVPGYGAGPYRPFHEILLDETANGQGFLRDASWNTTAKSTGATAIDFGVSFAGLVLPGVKAVLLLAKINDSGSAAGVASIEVSPGNAAPNSVFQLHCSGLRNDAITAGIGWASFNLAMVAASAPAVGSLIVTVTATGALTCDVFLGVVGMKT
jgi:hypothetical protein